jgi:hypothetical protein
MSLAFGQYQDDWVENKTVYQYMTQSGCACCGLQLQVDVVNFIEQCSDLDGEQNTFSAWPPSIRESVWKDRVKLRTLLKKQTVGFAEEWKRRSIAIVTHWGEMAIEDRDTLLHVSIPEVHNYIHATFDIGAEYAVVLQAVLEQVANFPKTLYKSDGVSSAELSFEQALTFGVAEKVFGLSKTYLLLDSSSSSNSSTSTSSNCNEDVPTDTSCANLVGFLARCKETTEAKLLHKASKTPDIKSESDVTSDADTPQNETDADVEPVRKTQSFRADRRLLRLIILRMFLERLFESVSEQEHSTASQHP